MILHQRPSKLLKLKGSDIELFNIDYEIMNQHFMAISEEKTPEEKKTLIQKMREEMKLGNTTGSG